jgi:hypothetical protein
MAPRAGPMSAGSGPPSPGRVIAPEVATSGTGEMLRGTRPSREALRVSAVLAVVAVGVVAAVFSIPQPHAPLVATSGGSWTFEPSTRNLTDRCVGCGVAATPGSAFIVQVLVRDVATQCFTSHCCPGYGADLGVGEPYTLISAVPNTSNELNGSAFLSCGGGTVTWTVTIQAPYSPGSFPLNGFVWLTIYS